jgi:hypothetical protein
MLPAKIREFESKCMYIAVIINIGSFEISLKYMKSNRRESFAPLLAG